MRLRRKGDIEICRIPVDDELVLEVGIRHEGPETINRWGQAQQAAVLAERRRLYDLRRELPQEAAPGVHLDVEIDAPGGSKAKVPAYKTAEGARAEHDLLESMVAEVICSLRGLPWDADLEGAEPAALAAELRRLGLIDSAASQAIAVQRLRAEDPLASGPGDAAAGGPPSGGAGPASSGGDGADPGTPDAEPVSDAVGPGRGLAVG